jgi:hypothetical protein
MSDIVDRLRAWADQADIAWGSMPATAALREAADEIEQLRAALATARRDERERCAIDLQKYAREVKDHGHLPVDPYEAAAQVLREAASAFRAMDDE